MYTLSHKNISDNYSAKYAKLIQGMIKELSLKRAL